MKLLAMETTGTLCSLALFGDAGLLDSLDIDEPRAHAQRLLPEAQTMLQRAGWQLGDLDVLAYGRGPGSFTGQRIGVAAIQALALGANLPAMPISSLCAVAQQALDVQAAPGVLVALDARMGEVYAGTFRNDAGWALVEREWLCRAETLSLQAGWLQAGNGWSEAPNALTSVQPTAATVAKLAAKAWQKGKRGVPAAAALPVYLRNRVAEEPRVPAGRHAEREN